MIKRSPKLLFRKSQFLLLVKFPNLKIGSAVEFVTSQNQKVTISLEKSVGVPNRIQYISTASMNGFIRTWKKTTLWFKKLKWRASNAICVSKFIPKWWKLENNLWISVTKFSTNKDTFWFTKFWMMTEKHR